MQVNKAKRTLSIALMNSPTAESCLKLAATVSTISENRLVRELLVIGISVRG